MSSQGQRDHLRALLERVFMLVSRIGDEMEREFEMQALTRARAELLWRLADAGPSTQSALSDALQCTPRNVTGLVDALEADDLVRRHAHPTDRRATLVTLTEEGSAIVDRWNRGYDELAHRMFDDVPDDDLHGFELTLDHVLDRLRDDQPPTDESTRVRSRPTRGTPTSGAGGG